MFERRRSFKVAPGIKVNTGKRGVTSVNIAGVRVGTGSRRGNTGSGRQTKAVQLAKYWRMKPGLWYVRFDTGDGDYLNLEVRGSELTFDRFKKMSDAAFEKNGNTEARIFRQFVAAWDLVDEIGKVEPISAVTLEKVSNGFFFGLTVEIVNALKIPEKPLASVLLNAKTDRPYPIRISDTPFPPSQAKLDTTQEFNRQIVHNDNPALGAITTDAQSKSGWIWKFVTGVIVIFVFLLILAAVI